MWIGVLGRLIVRDRDSELALSPGKQRIVLAALALRADRVVTLDELADVVWDGHPPGSAPVTLRNYVRRLRHALGTTIAGRIETQSSGYLLRLGPDEFDVTSFEYAVRQADAAGAARRWPDAARWAKAAIALWRGDPLADIRSATLHERHDEQLRQLRLRAIEWTGETALELGRHREVILDLYAATRDYPLNETLYAQLLLSLYRSGRAAEALDVYARARQILTDELGVDPGPTLRALYRRILTEDPALLSPGPVDAATVIGGREADDRVIPRQLPAAPLHFTGRTTEMDALTAWSRRTGTLVISAMGGMGKTALAVAWAHRSSAFPDGQLYVDLRGFGPQGSPLRPTEALRGFLTGLGVPFDQIPASTDDQAALYRSLTAGKRILVILDNARDADQVRPLLPGGAPAKTLVTSRSTFTSLVAAEGAHHLRLDVLTAADARDMLTRHLGAARLSGQDLAVQELITRCAGLPLALSIAGALAATTSRSVAAIVAELRGSHRLDALDAGDSTTDVRAVFAWSYRALADPDRRVFRLLGVLPGPDASGTAAAVLVGLDESQFAAHLARLHAAAFVMVRADGRIALHDLMAAFAAEVADCDQPAASLAAARRRLVTWYLRTTVAASRVVNPRRSQIEPDYGAEAVTPGAFASYDAALHWLEAERPVLVNAVAYAHAHDLPELAIGLALALLELFQLRRYWADWLSTHTIAIDCAVAGANREAEALLRTSLGNLHLAVARPEAALAQLNAAMAIRRDQGVAIPPDLIGTVGNAYIALGDIPTAVTYLRQSLALFRAQGSMSGETAALNNLGWAVQNTGEIEEAADLFRQGVELAVRNGNVIYEGATLSNYGAALWRLGRTDEAAATLERALAVNRQTGNRAEEANAQATLGHIAHTAGHDAEARRRWTAARDIFAAIGHPRLAEVDAALAAPEALASRSHP